MFYFIAILKLEINNYLIFYFSVKYDFILFYYTILFNKEKNYLSFFKSIKKL